MYIFAAAIFDTMVSGKYTYTDKQYIGSYLVDSKRMLTPTFLFNLMQEAAVNHADKLGAGWDYLRQFGHFWAMSRMDVEILRMPRWQETIVINTWPKGHNFLIQPRDHQIESEDGEILVRATTNWVILDLEGKPVQLSEYEEPLTRCEPELHAIKSPASRLRNAVPLENPIFKPVVYSNLDVNHHANNGAYVTWIMDSFDDAFHQSHDLSFLAINYLQQTHADDQYTIMKKETAEGDFLCSIYSQKNSVEVCRVRTVWKGRR